MMITVDTQVIIWDALRPELLSPEAKMAIAEANQTDGILFCDISLWEIAMLHKKGRISFDTSYLDFIRLVKNSNNYIYQGITPEIAESSTHLPAEVNLDTADRIIAATSLIMRTKLVTANSNFRKSKTIKTIW